MLFPSSTEFCAHKDFRRSGSGLALVQREWKGRRPGRFLPESHPDRDGSSSLSQGEKFWLHRTSVKTGIFWASLCLHQVRSFRGLTMFPVRILIQVALWDCTGGEVVIYLRCSLSSELTNKQTARHDSVWLYASAKGASLTDDAFDLSCDQMSVCKLSSSPQYCWRLSANKTQLNWLLGHLISYNLFTIKVCYLVVKRFIYEEANSQNVGCSSAVTAESKHYEI